MDVIQFYKRILRRIMKVKHVVFLSFLLAFLGTLILFFTGCGQSDLERRITAWKDTYPDRDGDCMIVAMKTHERYKNKGIRSRICHGYYKSSPHAWCEYESGDKWLVDDPSVGNEGYQRWEYTTNGKYDYVLSWWGE